MSGRAGPVRLDRFVLFPGDDGALAHFLGHLFVAHGVRERFRALAARGSLRIRAPSLAREILLGSPSRAPAGDAGEDVDPILRRVGLGGDRWIRLLDYAEGRRAGSVIFVFPARGREPRAVVKTRGPGTSAPSLLRERDALLEVRNRTPAQLRATVPEPLAYAEEGGTEILGLSFLSGVPAYAEVCGRLAPTRRAHRHLEAATRWLARFHDATADLRAPLDPEVDLPPVQALQDLLERRLGDPDGAGDPDLRWYRDLREALARRPLAATPVHGDFWARNLLLGRGSLPAVVDWEGYRSRGSPAFDLFHFPITYGLNHASSRRGSISPLEAFRRTFLRRNRLSRAVRSYLGEYGRVRGLSSQLLWHLLLLHLLTGARGAEAERATAASPSREPPCISAYALLSRADQWVLSR